MNDLNRYSEAGSVKKSRWKSNRVGEKRKLTGHAVLAWYEVTGLEGTSLSRGIPKRQATWKCAETNDHQGVGYVQR